MAKVYGLKKGENGTASINLRLPKTGTPKNAVAAQGTLTVDTQPTADDTMTIGTKVYAFKASATLSGHIAIAGTLSGTQTNIIAAINGTDSLNTANSLVSAGTFSTNVLTLTARTKGLAGTNIVTTETFTAATNVFNATTLGATTEGVNGTIALNGGECYIDDNYLYYCISANTVSDTNWRRISLGSAY